jgi:hypothetical protein
LLFMQAAVVEQVLVLLVLAGLAAAVMEKNII